MRARGSVRACGGEMAAGEEEERIFLSGAADAARCWCRFGSVRLLTSWDGDWVELSSLGEPSPVPEELLCWF